MLCVASLAQCTFVILVPDHQVTNEMTQGRGLFSEALYEEGDLRGCLSYSADSSFKGAFTAARVFGVFSALLLSASLLLVTGMVCFLTRYHLRRFCLMVMRIFLPMAFLFNAFMFTVFSADECKIDGIHCQPGSAGIVAAVNTIVIFIAAVLAIVVPGPQYAIFVPIWQVPSHSTELSRKTDLPETSLP